MRTVVNVPAQLAMLTCTMHWTQMTLRGRYNTGLRDSHHALCDRCRILGTKLECSSTFVNSSCPPRITAKCNAICSRRGN